MFVPNFQAIVLEPEKAKTAPQVRRKKRSQSKTA